MKSYFPSIIPTVFLFLLGACSETEPRIPFGTMHLRYYENPSSFIEERLSFFIMAEDDDGIENLSELYLYYDREGLRWLFTSGDWLSFTEDDTTWIGSHAIVMPGNESLPRGQYRAVLINRAGKKSERNFTLDIPASPRFLFPSLSISQGRYTIESEYPEHFLLCYDESGKALSPVKVTSFEDSIASLKLPAGTRSVALWAEDAEYQTSAITSTMTIR